MYIIPFNLENDGAIPSNLLAIANNSSQSSYFDYCKGKGLNPHPARFPSEFPEYFIRMLTDPGDLVVDPFGGSCVTGEVCERARRRWICIERVREYCEGALGRFERDPEETSMPVTDPDSPSNYYRIARPGVLFDGDFGGPLPKDGGKKRCVEPIKSSAARHVSGLGSHQMQLDMALD